MMKLLKTNSIILLFFSFLLFSELLQAQASFQDLSDALGFEENVNDVPEAPINMFLGIVALIGSYIGISKLKK